MNLLERLKSTEVRLTKSELLILIDYLGVIEDSEPALLNAEEKYPGLDVRELRGHLMNNYENI